MKMFVAMVALTGTLIGSGGALAFDVSSPNPDYEVREKSERLHVQRGWFPGNALAFAPQRTTNTIRTKQKVAPASADMYDRRRSSINPYINEVPEHKIGDRYPFLEQNYRLVLTNKFAGKYLAMRQASYVNQNVSQLAYEDPENKIGDRYPFLEQVYLAQRGLIGYATAGIRHKQARKQKG